MTDKVLLITGASTGIGHATALRAAEAGYRLVLAARSLDKLNTLVEEIGNERALAVACDVTDEEQQETMVAKTLDRFGRLDVLFANAGIGGSPGGFSGADPKVWREMLLTNVLGVGISLRVSLAALKEQRGHVVLTGSVAGRVPISGSMYSASKWAVSGIGYNLREELKGTGVRVTLIEPGMVDTPVGNNVQRLGSPCAAALNWAHY